MYLLNYSIQQFKKEKYLVSHMFMYKIGNKKQNQNKHFERKNSFTKAT